MQKLEELIANVNDVIENRIEKNLKLVSKTLLVDLPRDRSFTLEDFVRCQQEHIKAQAVLLQGKNVEIERSVEDLIEVLLLHLGVCVRFASRSPLTIQLLLQRKILRRVGTRFLQTIHPHDSPSGLPAVELLHASVECC